MLTDGEHITRSIDMMDWDQRPGDDLPLEIYVKSVGAKRYAVPCPKTVRIFVDLHWQKASRDEGGRAADTDMIPPGGHW